MKVIQKASAILIFEEPFYGFLLSKFKKIKSERIPTACVYVTDTINLEYNEAYLEKVGVQDTVKILKHECEHILRDHIGRAKDIGIQAGQQEMMKRLNLAADATINVKDLKDASDRNGWVTTEKLNEMMRKTDKNHVDMPEGETAEYYFNKVNQFAEENKDKLPKGNPMEGAGDTTDDHSLWEESVDSEEVIKQVTRQAVNDAVKSAGGIGNIPSHLVKHIESLNKSEVNWKKELRRFMVNALKAEWTSTRKKRNRRYGILYAGKKSKPKLHLAFCVDSSGSMFDAAFAQAHPELVAIHNQGVKITVIDADSAVGAVYDFDPKKPFKRFGNGGTSYQPAITKALELDVDGICYFGDMDSSDTPVNPKKPFLWITVGSERRPGEFGKMIKIDIPRN
jgi:predicted metal-dependent peptidase